jgi:hypothetical protein
MEVFALLELLLEVESLNYQLFLILPQFVHIMIYPFVLMEEIKILEICVKL